MPPEMPNGMSQLADLPGGRIPWSRMKGLKGIMGYGCSACEGQHTWTGSPSHQHMEMRLHHDRLAGEREEITQEGKPPKTAVDLPSDYVLQQFCEAAST